MNYFNKRVIDEHVCILNKLVMHLILGGAEKVAKLKSIPPMLPEDYFQKANNNYVNVMGVESAKNPKIPHRYVKLSIVSFGNHIIFTS